MRKGLVVGLLAAALAVAASSSASADFGFEPGSVQVTSLEAGGQPETQAGAHPDRLNIGFAFTRTPEGNLEGNARNFAVDLPAGYNGDPSATPRCTRAQIVLALCPPETQIGAATIVLGSEEGIPLPVYNVVPQPGVTAEFAMFIILFPVRLNVTLRERDFGVHVAISDILQELPLAGAQIELWGVPADHQIETSIPRRALLTLPTRCGVQLSTDVSVRTWEQPNVSVTERVPSGSLAGCAALDFSPTATVATDATTPDTPTGLHVGVDVPQHLGATELATAAPSQAIVTLPAGLELAPSLAQGMTTCGDAQVALGSSTAPACPAASRIGTVELDAPLGDPLRGGVYVATPAPGDTLRLFLTAQGPDHTVKLVGALRRDPDSGQLVATVEDLPQLPLSHIALDFQGGPRAPFVTPLACGPTTASVVLASWAGRVSAPATSTLAFGGPGGAPCPTSPPSAPTVAAGVSPPTSGASGAPPARFKLAGRVSLRGGTARKPGLRVSLRRSGGASVHSLAIALPRMLRLDDAAAATKVCGRDEAREDRCPAASRVGSASLSTPLLSRPMSAPVYLVASGRRGGLPGLRTSLAGDGVRAVLEGAIGVRRDGQVTSTFANLPDMPLTAFELRLRGGPRGLLTVDAQRCRLPRAQRTLARVAVRSQGGASASQALATGPWRGCAQRR